MTNNIPIAPHPPPLPPPQQQEFRLLQPHCTLPQIQQQQGLLITNQGGAGGDMDQVYMSSNAGSNVSPDSGIQSEGVASNSPMHLGEGAGGNGIQPVGHAAAAVAAAAAAAAAGSGLVIGNPAVIQGQHPHQGFHPAFQGSSYVATTGPSSHNPQGPQPSQPFAQLNVWNAVQHQQQSGSGFYSPFLSPTGGQQYNFQPFHHGQQQHQNGPVVIQAQRLAGGAPQMDQQHHQAVIRPPPLGAATPRPDTPPPILVPSVNAPSPAATPSAAAPSSSSPNSASVSVGVSVAASPGMDSPTSPVLVKRGRGRPKGSKNKVKKVTMECGSQTDESVLAGGSGLGGFGMGVGVGVSTGPICNNSDSDGGSSGAGSSGSLPPPLTKFASSTLPAVGSGGKAAKGERGRPRKDPPMLEPQISPSSSSSSVGKKSMANFIEERQQQQYLKKFPSSSSKRDKSLEVITLTSEESVGEDSDMDLDDQSWSPAAARKEAVIKKSKGKDERHKSRKGSRSKSKSPRKKKRGRKPKGEREQQHEEDVDEDADYVSASRVEKAKRKKKKSSHHSSSKSSSSKVGRHHRSVTPKVDRRDSSHSPGPKGSSSSRMRLSRHDAFAASASTSSFLGGANSKKTDGLSGGEDFSFTNGEVRPVFDSSYNTLRPDRFWRRSPSRASSNASLATTVTISESEPGSVGVGGDPSKRSSSAESSRVLTKASLKEMSSLHQMGGGGFGASTKTMLSVLAEANKMKSKPGRKKRGRKGQGSSSSASAAAAAPSPTSDWFERRGASPGSSCHSSKSPFSPRSNISGSEVREVVKYSADMLNCSEGYKTKSKKSKKKKQREKAAAAAAAAVAASSSSSGGAWKSKHKNVIDPVFLSEVEHVLQDMASCQIEPKLPSDFWPDRPHDSVPSIFRKRRILPSRSRRAASSVESDAHQQQQQQPQPQRRGRGRSKRQSRDEPRPGSSKGEEGSEGKSGAADSAEQRLPLKKRHHHHSISKQHADNGGAESSPSPLPKTATTGRRGSGSSSKNASASSASQNSEMQNRSSPAATTSSSSSRRQASKSSSSDISIIHEKNSSEGGATATSASTPAYAGGGGRKPTAADRLVEKLGIQNLVPSSSSSSSKAPAEKSTLKILEENSEKILGKCGGNARGGKSSPISSSSLIGSHLSPTKPIPPNESAAATSAGSSINSSAAGPGNFVDSLAACIDKYTAGGGRGSSGSGTRSDRGGSAVVPLPATKAKSLSQPLTVTVDDDNSTQPPPSSVKSPRKRHLLEMRKKNQHQQQEENNAASSDEPSAPPVLFKATPRKRQDSERVPQLEVSKTPTPPSIRSAVSPSPTKNSPPRLSPAHRSPSPPSLDKANVERKRHEPKYSDISDDDNFGEAPPPLQRGGGNAAAEDSRRKEQEDVFNRLAESAPKKPVKTIPMEAAAGKNPTSDEADEAPLAKRRKPSPTIKKKRRRRKRQVMSDESDQEEEEKKEARSRSRSKETATIVSTLPEPTVIPKPAPLLPARKLSAEELKATLASLSERAARSAEKAAAAAAAMADASEKRDMLMASANIDFDRDIRPLVVKSKKKKKDNGKTNKSSASDDDHSSTCSSEYDQQGNRIIKPRILRKIAAKLDLSGLSPRSREMALHECSVRVHKLTRKQIVESSPSPPGSVREENAEAAVNEKNEGGEFELPAKSSPLPPSPSVDGACAKDKNKASVNHAGDKDTHPDDPEAVEEDPEDKKPEGDVSGAPGAKVKRRKRRANRTGFPSTKKKRRATSSESGASSSRPSSAVSAKRIAKGAKDIAPRPVRASARVAEENQRKQQEQERHLEEHEEQEQQQQQQVPAAKKSKGGKSSKDPPSVKTDVLSQAISQIQAEQQGGEVKMKRPRGRPPKKRLTANSRAQQQQQQQQLPPNSSSCSTHSVAAPSKSPSPEVPLCSDAAVLDEAADCLSLLPPLGYDESCAEQSSEAPSGTEADGDSRSSSVSNASKRRKKDLFKKSSLKAGLFADTYKEQEQEAENGNGNGKKSFTYNPEEHPHGLLPAPAYCGKGLRARREDFQLPYDLWWLHSRRQLPGRDVAATWNYKRVKNNVFFDVKPVAQFEVESCHCRRPTEEGVPGCGEDCINRMTYTECDPRACPLGERCSNNAIRLHRGLAGGGITERFMTKEKGWGIRTKRTVPSSSFIMEYVGEVVSEKVFKHRMTHEYAEDSHHYCLHMDGSTVIDGHRMGGECR